LRHRSKSSYNAANDFEVGAEGSFEVMFWRVLVVFIVLLISVSAKMQRIPTGVWGGPHINIEVGEKSARIEYDCANGTIDGPLVVDGNGNFKLRGTHRVERGGPVRADDDTKGQPATYTGSIKGNSMTLTLKLAGSDDETFTLEKGKEGELMKCK
jgi:hypothetical protein